jgi:hypothetical protein
VTPARWGPAAHLPIQQPLWGEPVMEAAAASNTAGESSRQHHPSGRSSHTRSLAPPTPTVRHMRSAASGGHAPCALIVGRAPRQVKAAVMARTWRGRLGSDRESAACTRIRTQPQRGARRATRPNQRGHKTRTSKERTQIKSQTVTSILAERISRQPAARATEAVARLEQIKRRSIRIARLLMIQ